MDMDTALITPDRRLALLEQGKLLLAEARSLDEVKEVRDKAQAVEHYLRQRADSLQAALDAAELRLRAERRLGELLLEMAKHPGHRFGGDTQSPPTFAELGIHKKAASRWQRIARVPQDAFDTHVAQIRQGGDELTVAGLLRLATTLQRQAKYPATAPEENGDEEAPSTAPSSSPPESWQLITGDCTEELARLPANCARLIFADPPYNVGVDYGQGEDADLLPASDYCDWISSWLAECWEVLTLDGSLWVLISDEYAAEYVLALKRAGFTLRNWIKWYERFGINCTTKFNRTSRHLLYAVRDPATFVFNRETVLRSSDRQTKYDDPRAHPDGKILDDVWDDIPRLAGTHAERLAGFPTQLPLALLRRVILCATEPGDLVVDPVSGSSTTGVAALAHGRRYLGIERSETFSQLARQRLYSVQREIQPEVSA